MRCLSLIKVRIETKTLYVNKRCLTVNEKVIKEIEHEGFVSAEHLIKGKSNQVSGKLATYPSPKLTLTLTPHLGKRLAKGRGRWAVFQKPTTEYNPHPWR